ncbi:MAG TPA: hypothetical protein VFB80_01445 [Pirellulaceae bacterium]|nr:hypothetical protein [Pirellulaceae bacterium]
MQEHAGYHCANCGRLTMHVRDVKRCNHLVHALVTLFLCGLWLPVWIIAACSEQLGPWLCSQCGFSGGVSPFQQPQQQHLANAQAPIVAQEPPIAAPAKLTPTRSGKLPPPLPRS